MIFASKVGVFLSTFSFLFIQSCTSKDGEQDRYWELVAIDQSGKAPEYIRTHTQGDSITIFDACDASKQKGIAKRTPNEGWQITFPGSEALGTTYVGVVSEDGVSMTIRVGGEDKKTGRRIEPPKCENNVVDPASVKSFENEAGERVFAAATSSGARHLEQAANSDLTLPEFPSVTPTPRESVTFDLGEVERQCDFTPRLVREARSFVNQPILSSSEQIYPGLVVQGINFATRGVMTPLTIPRAAMNVTISGVSFARGVQNTIAIPQPTSEAVRGSIRNAFSAGAASGQSANISFSTQEIYSPEHLLYVLGLDSRFLSGSLINSFRFSSDARLNYSLTKITQVFYQASMETPQRSYSVFQDGPSFEDPQGEIGAGNPPLYVSNVSYGRAFYILVESPDSVTSVTPSISAAYRSEDLSRPVGDGSDVSMREILARSNVQAFAIGDRDLGGEIITGRFNSVFGQIKDTLLNPENSSASEDNLGAPIFYSLNLLTSRAALQMPFVATYQQKSCFLNLPDYYSFSIHIDRVNDNAEIFVDGESVATFADSADFDTGVYIPDVDRDFTVRVDLVNGGCFTADIEFHVNRTFASQEPAEVERKVYAPIGWSFCSRLASYEYTLNPKTGAFVLTSECQKSTGC